MATHQIRLKERQGIAEGTMAFHFEKPVDFAFKAGQFMSCTLIDSFNTDAEGNTRTFPIASPPDEADFLLAAAKAYAKK
jgi:ferredoxin-NADP reductase